MDAAIRPHSSPQPKCPSLGRMGNSDMYLLYSKRRPKHPVGMTGTYPGARA